MSDRNDVRYMYLTLDDRPEMQYKAYEWANARMEQLNQERNERVRAELKAVMTPILEKKRERYKEKAKMESSN